MKEQVKQSFAQNGKIAQSDSYKYDATYREPPELVFQKYLYNILAVVSFISSWIALPFTRISFGENLFSIINASLVAAYILFFLDEHTRLFDVYVFLVLFHFAWVLIRKYFFDHNWWYSKSYGISISYLFFSSILNPFFKGKNIIPENIYASYIDPILFILLSSTIYGADSNIGKFLIAGGVALFVKERINAFWQRQEVLTERDMIIWREAGELEEDKLGANPFSFSGLFKGFRTYNNNTISINTGLGFKTTLINKKEEKMDSDFTELHKNQAM